MRALQGANSPSLIQATVKPVFKAVPLSVSHKQSQQKAQNGAIREARTVLDSIGFRLGVKQPADWYRIRPEQVDSFPGGHSLLEQHNHNMAQLLSSVYPQHTWNIESFNNSMNNSNGGLWSSQKKCQQFLDRLADELNIKTKDDWYRVTLQDIKKHGGAGILAYFGNSLYTMLTETFPDVEWKPWLFGKLPGGTWDSLKNRRAFLDHVSRDILGYHDYKDWYQVTWPELVGKASKAGSLLALHNHSPLALMQAVFPEFNWKVDSFKRASKSALHTKRETAQQLAFEFCERVAERYQIMSVEDWYKVAPAQLRIMEGGATLLSTYDYNLYQLLKTAYPDKQMEFGRFVYKPGSPYFQIWREERLDKLSDFCQELARLYHVKHMEDWYKITEEQIRELGGQKYLDQYLSLYEMLVRLFPEHDWHAWKFVDHNVPRNYWEIKENVKKFMKDAEKKLRVTKAEDWYDISNRQLIAIGGGQLIGRYNGLFSLLLMTYPSHNWDRRKLNSVGKVQKLMTNMVQQIIPSNTRMHINFPIFQTEGKRKRQGELDIYIPSLMLAFEYQGAHHYEAHYLYGAAEIYQARDEVKKQLCKKLGITLIEVPYWWDQRIQSLLATIHEHRVDVVAVPPANAQPIPKEKPAVVKKQFTYQPSVGDIKAIFGAGDTLKQLQAQQGRTGDYKGEYEYNFTVEEAEAEEDE